MPQEERLLLRALEAVGRARLNEAERHLKALLAGYPTFELARLVYADVLLARSGRLVDFGSGAAQDRVRALRAEAMARLANAEGSADPNRLPDVLLQLSRSQSRVLVVDVAASRLHVYAFDGSRVRRTRSFYVSTGKNGAAKRREGDQRTPVGVYFVTGKIAGDALPDFYGPGALPVNYPNEWDRRLGRTGYGIWIHGVPSDTFARPPRASDGCVALSNEHLTELLALARPEQIPVIISDGIRWVDTAELAGRRRAFLARMEEWRRDWESGSLDRYARHYSSRFRSDLGDVRAWIGHKRRVNARKRFIQVRVEDLSVFAYPGESEMMVVSFEQDYRSSNFSSRSRKRQYWQREADGQWRIVHEGPPKLHSEHLRGIPYSARARLSSR